MKKSELIEVLSSSDEEEVLIEIDGLQYEIAPEVGHADEEFDGFDTVFPEAVTIKPIIPKE